MLDYAAIVEDVRQLIYFNPVGLPVLDVIVASRLFEKALKENMRMLLGSQMAHWILTGDLPFPGKQPQGMVTSNLPQN